VNSLIGLGIIVLAVLFAQDPSAENFFVLLTALSLLLGVLFVLPIGGADMPVVISFLNSASGLAAGVAGFVVSNQVLIISGALVGASGLILTQIMCKGMNRTLGNVLFGSWGASAGAQSEDKGERNVRSVDAEEAAMILGYAKSVIIVPGYGMAVAQAQHAVRELTELMESRQIDVKFAIHPVAGRMPGHMNVLLAEANVPYNKLYDMEDINPEFQKTDVALVMGANDVVNPAAKSDPGSPIYGMPVLNVDQAKHVIVIKRSLNPGFSGIDNDLFYDEKTMMFFSGAKQASEDLIREVKELG
jgi:NAD(P) transhydrogenase subunit beta